MPRNRTAGVGGGCWDQHFVFLYLYLIYPILHIKRPPFSTVIKICFCYKSDNYAYIGLLVNFNSVPLPSLMVDILVLVLCFSLRLLCLFFPFEITKGVLESACYVVKAKALNVGLCFFPM